MTGRATPERKQLMCMAGNLKDEMESLDSSPNSRLLKFYSSDVHDEVDLHFARALSTEATKSDSSEGSPKSEGTCIAEQCMDSRTAELACIFNIATLHSELASY